MSRVYVRSSQIVCLDYDVLEHRLTVEFVGGGLYEYDGVPEVAVCRVVFAESVGKAFNQEIKGKYVYRKLKPEPLEAQRPPSVEDAEVLA